MQIVGKGNTSTASDIQYQQQMKLLIAAENAFKELDKHLKEGTKFYADLTQLLLKNQGAIQDFCTSRKLEADELVKNLGDVGSGDIKSTIEAPKTSASVVTENSNPPARPPLPNVSNPPSRPPPPTMATAPGGPPSANYQPPQYNTGYPAQTNAYPTQNTYPTPQNAYPTQGYPTTMAYPVNPAMPQPYGTMPYGMPPQQQQQQQQPPNPAQPQVDMFGRPIQPYGFPPQQQQQQPPYGYPPQ